MAQELHKKTRFNASAEHVLKVVTNPEFLVAKEKAMDSLEASYKELTSDGTTLKYELHTVEYARGMTGIDRSKTEKNVQVVTWNLPNRSCVWSYRSDSIFADRFTVSGDQKVVPAGDGACDLVSTFKVDIRVPLVGKKIEKMVLEEVDKAWPRYDRTVEEFVKRFA